MADDNKLPYLEEYYKFIDEYNAGQVSGEQVGVLISRMAQYYAEQNLKFILADRALSLVAKEIEAGVDENTGKSITSAKAQTIIAATDEAFTMETAKAHVQNIEQFINALKALQKGVLNEFSHMGS